MSNFFKIKDLIRMGVTVKGTNVKISKLARIYNPHGLTLHDNVRIDDFTILSGRGKIEIGNFVHIGPHSYITSFTNILLKDYVGLSAGVKLFGSSDDYSGKYMTNPTVPSKYLGTVSGDITLNEHCIVGSGSLVLPNVVMGVGSAVGSLCLITKNTMPWKLYAGSPAKIIKDRSKKCMELEKKLIKEMELEKN